MDILVGLAGLVFGAISAWQLARRRAAAETGQLRARLEERVSYWRGESERARATAARVSDETAAWVAGCQQGREDLLSLARVLAQHPAPAGNPPAPGPGET